MTALSFTPRIVFIPVADPRGNGGQLIHVRADDVPPAYDASLIPQIAELAHRDLYEAGNVAINAIRRLRLRTRGPVDFQRLRPRPIPGFLSTSDGPGITSPDTANARSAELGLALALLAYGGQCSPRLMIATGKLNADARDNGHLSETVAVEPVGELPRKFEAILTTLREGRIDLATTKRVQLFLPERTATGEDVLKVHANDLDRLGTVVAEQGGTLEVCPVGTLNDAIGHLGIDGLAPTLRDRLLFGGAAAVGLAMVASTAAYLFLNAAIGLSLGEIVLADGAAVSMPIRAVFEPGRKAFVMLPACLGAQATPVFRVGESLVLRAAINDRAKYPQVFGGYHFTLVAVSAQSGHSGIKVFPKEAIGRSLPPTAMPPTASPPTGAGKPRLPDDYDLSIEIPIEGLSERVRLFVLARRGFAINANKLRTDLEALLANKSTGERINAATTWLARQAPGYLDYTFRTETRTETEASCDPQ